MKNTTYTNNIAHHTTNAATNKAAAFASNTAVSNEAFFSTEEINITKEARHQAVEALTRVFIWVVEGTNAPSREIRATIAIFCVRPDLLGSPTLAQLGNSIGIAESTACKLAHDFRASMGL